jgi:hypothetical protein
MAATLSADLGRPLTVANVRQILHRARDWFATYLLSDVAESLKWPSQEAIAEELLELHLFDYCRSALERHARHRFHRPDVNAACGTQNADLETNRNPALRTAYSKTSPLFEAE